MKCLTGLPLLIHIELYEGVGVGVLKIEESASELLCTDFTALGTSRPFPTFAKEKPVKLFLIS
jgi:hypothetical protein